MARDIIPLSSAGSPAAHIITCGPKPVVAISRLGLLVLLTLLALLTLLMLLMLLTLLVLLVSLLLLMLVELSRPKIGEIYNKLPTKAVKVIDDFMTCLLSNIFGNRVGNLGLRAKFVETPY